MIKTKIIATLGPSSLETAVIKRLIDEDVDVFRLNFSHGSLDEHAETLHKVNQVRAEHNRIVAVMGDLCGPKIRTSIIEPAGQTLKVGDEVSIIPELETGSSQRFGTNYQNFSEDVQVGHRVLIDDGQIALQVIDQQNDQTICKVVVGGPISSHKGINLPDSDVSAASITEKDWRCVDWAIRHQLEFLALSFVRSAEEVNKLKQYLRQADSDIKVVSKIEKPQAVEHLESIVQASDAVLVARGDLGVEMDFAQVALTQKHITNLCRRLGKPVIVATQMLQSMIESASPTRAEVSDVTNAIMDLTDAVMLSGETAVGKYPIPAVQTITRIARVTEAFLDQSELSHPKIATIDQLAVTAALTRSVAQITEGIDAKLVATWSQTAATARLLSKDRIDVPIIAFSSNEIICRQMALHYGVIPIYHPVPANSEDFIQLVEQKILENNWAQRGDQILLLTGRVLGTIGTNNSIIIHTISGPETNK